MQIALALFARMGWTPADAAKITGASLRAAQYWFAGEKPPAKQSLWMLLDAAGLPRDWTPPVGPAAPATRRVVDADDPRVERDPFRTLVPLYDVAAACGAFRGGQEPRAEGWVEAPHLARPGRFVVRAKGDSMEPGIRDGDYVVVERRAVDAGLPENNPTVLLEYDDGGTRQHAIKILVVAREPHATPQNPRRLVTLLSTNPRHPPISVRDAGVTVVGEVVGVLE